MRGNDYYIKLAIRLALRAKGRTSPNPLVGALVVRNSRIVGRGYHRRAGSPHAEVVAIERAGRHASGAVLYVTLEPCTHFGKTPPCVDKIIASGIRKVVIGMVDPNPLNNGKGIKILKEHGIEVECGFMEEELRKINEAFIKYITKRLPFVTVKIGQSLDGKIATRSGESRWITSDESRQFANKIRQYYDAVMVGVNTVIKDDPQLSVRIGKKIIKQPKKIIVDSRLSTSQNAKLFNGFAEVIIATLKSDEGQKTANRDILSQKARILDIKERSGQVNLYDMMKKLANLGITNILVEGGGSLIGSLFDEGLVDKAIFFVAPKIIGGAEAHSSVEGQGIKEMSRAKVLKDIKVTKFKQDLLVEGYIK